MAPGFRDPQPGPPVTILREQASLIAGRTQGLVEGNVMTSYNGEKFIHQFFLVVPSLGNYSYRLLFVQHTIKLYPATVTAEVLGETTECTSPEAFIGHLRYVFGTEQAKEVVRILMAQAQPVAT